MPQYLPSKKVFAVAFLAMGVLGWTIVSKHFDVSPLAATRGGTIAIAHAESALQDSDNDGLPDWQETLYGTDPQDPDSDGNGIPDGVQFDPKKQYPNITESDSVYQAINQVGEGAPNAPDPTSQLSLSPVFYKDTYSKTDVVQTENSTSSVPAYIANTILLLAEHADANQSKPLDIINHWLQTYDENDTKQIQKISADNKALAAALINIPVPPDIIEIHLHIANYLYDSALALDDVLKTLHDPTAGFFAAANYANYESKYTKAVIALTQYANSINAQ